MNKVNIENNSGRLRLRWRYQNKRHTMAVGVPDSPTGWAIAKQKAAQIEVDITAGYFDPTLLKYKPRHLGKTATEISALELFTRYTKAMKQEKNLSNGALCKYQGVKAHLKKYLGDTPAKVIISTNTKGFTQHLLNCVNDHTTKQYLFLLQSCWVWSQGKYHTAVENPWSCEISKIKLASRPKRKPFSKQEIKKILEAFRNHKYYRHYYPFVVFQLNCGTRPGEASALTWAEISEDFSSVWIHRSQSRGVVRNRTKTGKDRVIPLNSKVQEILRELKLANSNPTDLVFPSVRGGYLDDRQFCRRPWRSILSLQKIDYRPPYTCRNSAGSHALLNGQHYLEVAALLGHNSRVLLDRYSSEIEKPNLNVEF